MALSKDKPSKAPRSRSGKVGNDISPITQSITSHALHQTLGNQAVQRLLHAGIVQAKLRVSLPNDSHEQGADRLAEQALGVSQPAEASGARENARRPSSPSSPASFADSLPGLQPDVDAVLHSSGEPLDPATRAFMEPRFGQDFGVVRIHTDARAARSAEYIDALAYTAGPHIVFGAGQYSPAGRSGRQLIAHELAHVVQQSAASVPVVMRWARDADGRFTLAAVEELRSELRKRGIAEEQLGDIEAIADLGDDNAIRRLLATLDRFIHEDGRLGDKKGSKSPNYPGRIVASWNVNKDDLGITNKRPGVRYKSILHYIDTLERLAQASMGKDYVSAATSANTMPNVRLSGARMSGGGVGVHPRALYFVAAGQVEIDEAAARAVDAAAPARKQAADTMRRAFGEGHYVPAGGFQWLLKDVIGMLNTLAYTTKPNPRAKSSKSKQGVARTTRIDQGALIYKVLRLEIARMLLVLQGQEDDADVPSHEASAHREPELRRYLLPKRKEIEAVAGPDDDDDTPRAAREMLAALGSGFASVSYYHGAGSIDPHGTDHAMGLAIDYYNGRGDEGSYHNYSVEHWAFIHRLIAENGQDFGIPTNLRPTSIHAVSPTIARAISSLIQDRGAKLAQTVREEATAVEAEEKADPALKKTRKKALTAFTRLRGEVAYRMAQRRGAIARISETQKRQFPLDVRQKLAELAVDMKGFGNVIENFSATDVIEMLDGVDSRLDEIHKQADDAVAAAAAQAAQEEQAAEQGRSLREEEALAKEKQDVAGVQAERDADLAGIDAQIKKVDADLAATDLDRKAGTALKRERSKLDSRRASAARKWKAAEKREGKDIARASGKFAEERRKAAAASRKAAAVRTSAQLALAKVAPDPDPLEDLLGPLHDMEAEAEEAYAIEITRALTKEMNKGGFKRWLDTVSDPDRPIFDQPNTIVEGLNRVAAHADPGTGAQHTHFFSGHHWTIAPREILESTDAYRASLERDVGSRNLDQLKQILSVMAESEGGRAILFGASTDATFDAVLQARLEKLGTSTAEVLADIRKEIIAKYASLPGKSGELLRDLRDRGYYLAETK